MARPPAAGSDACDPSRGWTGRLQGDRNTTLSFGLGSWSLTSRRERGILRAAACAAVFGWQTHASAAGEQDPSPLPIAARVEGEFCSTLEAVEFEAARRSPRLRLLRDVPAEKGRVSIEGRRSVERTGAGANLLLDVPGQAPRLRELWAKDCDELVRAVGFVISVTFDPPAPEPNEPAAPSAPDASKEPTQSEKATLEGAGSAAPSLGSAPLRGEAPTRRRSMEDEGRYAEPGGGPSTAQWRAGLGGSAAFGVSPNPLWGASAFLDVHVGAAPVTGLFRLQLGAETNFGETLAGGNATFQRWTAALFAGPKSEWGRVYVAPTGFARGGVLEARGSDTLESRQHREPWLEAGLAMIFGVEVSSGWFWEVSVAGTRPLTRYAFQFEPVVFHRVSPWLAHVGIFTSAKF